MSNKRLTLTLILMVVLGIMATGCASNATPVLTATAVPTNTTVPTQTVLPTMTASSTSKSSATPTVTQAPTQTPLPTATATATPIPAVVLFSDTFVDNRNGWSIGPSKASDVAINAGHLSVAMKTANFFNIGPVPTSLPADVDISFDSAVEINSGSGTFAGAVCRGQNGSNFYLFQVFSTKDAGVVAISKVLNGKLTMLAGPTGSAVIKVGQAVNTVRVVCLGDQLQLSVNGSVVAAVKDNSLKEGIVALYSEATAPGSKVTFANLVIRAAEPNALKP